MKRNDSNGGYGQFARVYDRLISDVDYKALAEYYDGLIKQNGVKSGILLDLACGTGTLSQLMSKLGWDVIGADNSPEMLSEAAVKNSGERDITYVCQNMCELDLYGTIDACICALDGLNHLRNGEALLAVLKRVSLFMNAGGIFVFDLNTIYKHSTILSGNIFLKQCANVFCAWQNAYTGSGAVDITLDVFERQKNGLYSRFTEEIRERAYPLDLIRDLAERAGFGVSACYDFMTFEAGSEDCEKVAFVLIKKEQNEEKG